MPTVFRYAGLRFVIYVDDHPPAHVHVEGKGGQAKIVIDGADLLWTWGFARADMKIALDTVRSCRVEFQNSWAKIHG